MLMNWMYFPLQVWGGFAPLSQIPGALGAQRPPSQNFSKKRKKNKKYFIFSRYLPHGTLLFSLTAVAAAATGTGIGMGSGISIGFDINVTFV